MTLTASYDQRATTLSHTRLPVTPAEVRYRAARYIASSALNADDASLLLAALGLTPADGLSEERPT